MKASAGSLFLVLAFASSSDVGTPVDRVISLLTKLTVQVQKEGIAEAASYDKYACFCKEQANDKVYVIAKRDKKIKELQADIKMLKADITNLDDAVGDAKKDKSKEAKAVEKSKKERAADHKSYGDSRKELVEAVRATTGALETMQGSSKDVDEELALMQTSNPMALGFIEGATAGARYGKPGVATQYKYASKDVIATLETLTRSFKKSLAELDIAEINSRSGSEKGRGARANTMTALSKQINEKQTLSASKGEDKSDKEELRNQEITARKADQAFLDDLTSRCEAKAKAWDQRSTTRASELQAMTQATALLNGMGNTYSANSKLVGLISKDSKPSVAKHAPVFFQLQSAHRVSVNEQKMQQLTSVLSKEAHSLTSAPLAMLALQLGNLGPDHFVKVRGLIKDLISKLKADATAEATSKGVCDKNMKAAIEKRDKNAANRETAGAQIDVTESTINSLKEEMVDLSKEIAGLNKELLEATELRAGEKSDNLKTLANAGTGKQAVDAAITILNKFYANAFLQAPKDSKGKTVGDMAPETFSNDKYSGKQDSSKGIVGMLEVISSDFDRTTKAVTASEADALKDYNKLKQDTEKAIKDKTKLKKTRQGDADTKKSELTEFKGDLKDAKKMNSEALEELEKLTAACVSTGETYAERAKHRKQEIAALKQAMEILDSWQD